MYRILIIENNDSITLSLTQILSKLTTEIYYAEYGEAGVLIASKQKPDIIFCSQDLPDMTGAGVLRYIRKIETLHFSSFYILAENEFNNIGYEHGLDHYFSLPLDERKVLSTIQFQQTRKNQIRKEVKDQVYQQIQHDLHDGIKQQLIHTHFALNSLTTIHPEGMNDRQLELIENAAENVENALSDIQWISNNSMHPIIESEGLIPAIEEMINSLNTWEDLNITFTHNIDHLTNEDALQIYYFVLESLSNITKYAQASDVKIGLHVIENELNLSIEDNGKGFNKPYTVPRSLEKRSQYWKNSELQFYSDYNKGVKVQLKIPNLLTVSEK
ncbi:ATP-binding response regulator [Sediminitomix flava]|uniref:histidine kinase n=1 Tax=Sediminitomix flava TaxID=379075 RepID=A0A315ZAA8_SEDFL|nr:response regulator [Sediminitomix flava]PWJ42270.1 response regulator receiver domain-containing protein [Sediminitomix flava]